MPIFEYLCKDCGRPFEKIVPRYDSQADCVHCNSENVEKQLSVFAVARTFQRLRDRCRKPVAAVRRRAARIVRTVLELGTEAS